MISPLLMVIELWFSVQFLPVDKTLFVQQEHVTMSRFILNLLCNSYFTTNYLADRPPLHIYSIAISCVESITEEYCRLREKGWATGLCLCCKERGKPARPRP